MYFFVYNQIQIFVCSIVCGVLTGILNEPFRFMRYIGFNTKTEIFIQDILFMSISGFVTFFFALCYNNGDVRFFIIAGELSGFLLFRYTAGILSGKIFHFLVRLFSRAGERIKKVFNVILTRIVKIMVWLLLKIPFFNKKQKTACNKGNFYCIITKSANIFKR